MSRCVVVIATALFVASGILAGVALDPGMPLHTAVLPGLANISFDDMRNPDFYSRVERLFNNHFPYRDTLRRTKAWVDYYVFWSSPVPEVHVGRDRWLYYRHELHDYQKDVCGQTQVMRDLARQLHELEEVVEASGRRFVFIVAPNKSTIYPEYVGLSRSPRCGKSPYDLLMEAFDEYPVRRFIRLDQMLREAKAHDQVYFKTDTHWNDVGARLVARAVLQEFPPAPWRTLLDEVTMKLDVHSGDLAHMMGLGVSELAPHAQMKPLRSVEVEEHPLPLLNIGHVRVIPEATAGVTLFPRAVFYHDSFMVVLQKFLNGAFEQIDAYSVKGGPMYLPIPGSEQSLGASGIVFVEVVERHLTSLKMNVDAFREVLRNP
jgi:hypothetical protein